MRRALKRDKAFDEFAAANDRLDGMVANLRSYINSLRQFCDCHSAFSASLVDGLSGFGSVAADVNAYHAASQQWCRTSKVPHVDSSLHSKVEVALELAAIDPIVAHIEVRRSLQEQLATATGTNRKALLEEVELLSQSMGGVMKGPIRALRQAQVDLLGTAAAVADVALNVYLVCKGRFKATIDQHAYNIVLQMGPWRNTTLFTRGDEGWCCMVRAVG